MVDDLTLPEDNTACNVVGRSMRHSRGLRAWHVEKGKRVNVGDPISPPQWREVSTNKPNKRGSWNGRWGSQRGVCWLG